MIYPYKKDFSCFGFTLIEALVYTCLCSLFLLAVISVFGTAFGSYENFEKQARIEESRLFVSEKINRQIRTSTAFDDTQNTIEREPWHVAALNNTNIEAVTVSPSVFDAATSSMYHLQVIFGGLQNAPERTANATWTLNYYGISTSTENN